MRNPIYFFAVFAVIGLPCLLLAFYFTFNTFQDNRSWELASGTITGFDGRGYPDITFTHDGKEFQFHSNFQDSNMQEGQSVQVTFPAGNPRNAQIKSFFNDWFLPLFLGVFGLVFGGVGFGGIFFQLRKSGTKKELFDEGRGKKISADFTGAQIDRSYRVNGVSPYIITAQWVETSTQTMYLFKSDYIWYDPTSVVGDKKKIDVYVDEQNMKRYYMDISFLPKQAN